MSLSMYQASVPVFLQMLNNLSAILDKAEAYAESHKIDAEVLLNYRLAPDMFPFVRQIQIAADLAKGAAARLAGVEVPKHDDTEKTLADLKARITNTATFVQSIQPSDVDGSEDRDITLTLGEPGGKLKAPTTREYETVGYVISGSAKLDLEGQTLNLKAGDSWLVPAGAMHQYTIIEPFTAVEATAPPAEVHGRDAPA